MSFLVVIFYGFIIVASFQLLFFLGFFSKFALLKPTANTTTNRPVSVIICAKNEAEHLKEFLPSILNQKYSNFEIVLINDASSDNTLDIIETFAAHHNNIKIVDVKNNEAFWANKKYALTLGLKAAKHEHLLFTNANCKPISDYWIQEMSACFQNEKSIVLGYGSYSKIKNSFLNKLIRFETMVTAMHYFSFAKANMPLMGVGRNLAYTKTEFFKVNGFINHIKVRSGDDSLFVNQAANKRNTAISISQNSFTESTTKTTFSDWLTQKKRHYVALKYFKLNHKLLLALQYSTQILFWFLAVILFISTFKWQIVLAIFMFRFIIYYVIVGISSKKLGETDLIYLLPFLEIFLMCTQLPIFINNLFSKPKHWI